MLQRAKRSGEFVAAWICAVMIAGAIYVGVLLLNEAPVPEGMHVIEGAIRLSQPEREKPVKELDRKKPKDTEPPKELPKTFSTKAKNKPVKPMMSISTPSFSADTLPGLKGDIAIPSADFGGIGFNMDEVDDIPQVLRQVPPQYPYSAKRNRVEGQVVIRMLVTAKGTPEHLSIHSASPPGVFDKAALNAAKRWRFRPGQYKGQAVDTWVLLPFNFELTR